MKSWYILSRFILYTGFAGALYIFYTVVYLHPCQRIQTYSVGEIFPINAIEQWRLEELLWSVEDMWEQSSGLQLFSRVDGPADITVNIIQKPEIADIRPGESFEKGSHYRGEINIYHFENEPDLVKVLAHEFGHALDLNHVAGDQSIMASTFMNRTVFPLSLTQFDRDEFRAQCRKL